MRDGTRLATDLYIPTKDGRPLKNIPAVLLRTPYGKHSWGTGRDMFRFFAKHGYLSVTQDVRGCFRSEGSLVWHQQEAKDGYDAIEWLARHPLCNGRVGTQRPFLYVLGSVGRGHPDASQPGNHDSAQRCSEHLRVRTATLAAR